ncbi:hypothetical protein BZ164_06250 [Pseudomonas veronii]|nr:hypothetical protein BZ164_06250 [Pseudomonas veronii]
MFSCSENEQKQLNTWVSFQSAEQPLLGQFSVSGNTRKEETAGFEMMLGDTELESAVRCEGLGR